MDFLSLSFGKVTPPTLILLVLTGGPGGFKVESGEGGQRRMLPGRGGLAELPGLCGLYPFLVSKPPDDGRCRASKLSDNSSFIVVTILVCDGRTQFALDILSAVVSTRVVCDVTAAAGDGKQCSMLSDTSSYIDTAIRVCEGTIQFALDRLRSEVSTRLVSVATGEEGGDGKRFSKDIIMGKGGGGSSFS